MRQTRRGASRVVATTRSLEAPGPLSVTLADAQTGALVLDAVGTTPDATERQFAVDAPWSPDAAPGWSIR